MIHPYAAQPFHPSASTPRFRHALRGFAVGLLACFVVTNGAWASPAPTADAARANNIGVALMEQQLLDKALAQFNEAHSDDPASVVPLLNKGLALIYLRRSAEAVTVLEQATHQAQDNPRVWFSLGIAQLTAGDQSAALQAFQHASSLAPTDPDAHYYIGSNYLAQHQYAQAVAEFRKTLALSPLQASAQYGLARALMGMGETKEAREHLQRFGEITHAKIGTLLSANYGEQGSLAMAQNIIEQPSAANPMIPVRFVPGTVTNVAKIPAAGACIVDLTGTGEKDLLSLGEGPDALKGYHLAANGAPTTLDMKHAGLALEGHGVSCAVGDYDNDGLPDIAVTLREGVHLFHNLGHGRFADVTTSAGLRALNRPGAVTFVDFDHDGDLDLFLAGEPLAHGGTPNVLWRNNGNGTFTEWTTPPALGGHGDTDGVILSDINNDRAVDLVVTGAEGSTIYENQREGAFRKVALGAAGRAARGVATLDYNQDGWMDIAVTEASAPGITLWRNQEGDRFVPVPLPAKGITAAWGVTPIDFDNDGRVDLAALVQTPQGMRVRVWRNLGAKGFADTSAALGLANLNVGDARTLLAADVDGDGAADLVIPQSGAAPLVLHNVGGSRNHSLRLDLAGLADNKLAIGTKVEVISNGTVQKFEIAGASGYMGQGSTEVLAGLGNADHADVVRMLWPTGVPQDELEIAANKTVTLHELDRRGSSCPVLFAWDGSGYRFVADVIGAGVVGHWVAPHARNNSDPDEWIKVDGGMLKPTNGLLSLRFGEPMEEINYIDQLRLVAVDHPDGTEVYPDERFLDAKPFANGAAVVASSATRLPAGAWGDHGEDVLPLLAKRDHDYVRDFTNLHFDGFAKRHDLTLDLGAWSADHPLRLFLTGYIEYFSASSMYSAWQAGLHPESPKLEAQLPDGSWKPILADMGFPAGLPRTIVVDLTGKLPPGTRKVRIRSNLQIYWDQALVDNGDDASHEARQYDLPLATAHLAFRGYPKQVEGRTPGDLTYDYQQISATGPFQWQRGAYTRYGAVTPLLNTRDDQYVIFGSGEEIDAEFSDASLPPLPAHWKRDYFFYANGFVKDMDFYEASPFTVAQLPFHAMATYPYAADQHYPQDEQHLRYQLQWNTRFESGERSQYFQFNYKPTASKPMQGDR